MEDLDPNQFAREWMAAWNARDLEAVLAHFSDDAMFSSPVALRMGHGIDGVLTGKDAIRQYWTAALALKPALPFTVRSVHAGVNVLAIAFDMHDGKQRTEILIFEGGLVRRGYGTGPS